MAQIPTDKDILGAIGRATLLKAGVTEDAIKKWRKRGIPHKDRGKVAKLAAAKRVRLPRDFRDERRAAP